jgi:hypothetical protein
VGDIDTRALQPDPESESNRGAGRPYRLALAPIWKSVSIYDGADVFLEQFDGVTRAQGALLAASWCQSEVCNGGFHQFFQNPTGILAPEAADGFDFLELSPVAHIVRRAIRMFGDPYPREQHERDRILRGLELPGDSRKDWDPFTPLDHEFYSIAGTKAFGVSADMFVRAHNDLFFRSSGTVA